LSIKYSLRLKITNTVKSDLKFSHRLITILEKMHWL